MNKVKLYTAIVNAVCSRFEITKREAAILPFSATNVGPTKIVTLDVVGHQMCEQLLKDIQTAIAFSGDDLLSSKTTPKKPAKVRV